MFASSSEENKHMTAGCIRYVLKPFHEYDWARGKHCHIQFFKALDELQACKVVTTKKNFKIGLGSTDIF